MTVQLIIGMECPNCEQMTGLVAIWDGKSPIPCGKCGYCHGQFSDMSPENAYKLIETAKPELLPEIAKMRTEE